MGKWYLVTTSNKIRLRKETVNWENALTSMFGSRMINLQGIWLEIELFCWRQGEGWAVTPERGGTRGRGRGRERWQKAWSLVKWLLSVTPQILSEEASRCVVERTTFDSGQRGEKLRQVRCPQEWCLRWLGYCRNLSESAFQAKVGGEVEVGLLSEAAYYASLESCISSLNNHTLTKTSC